MFFERFQVILMQKRGPSLSEQGQRALKVAIYGAASALESNVDYLNELDSGCGDGDCGSTLNRWVEGKYFILNREFLIIKRKMFAGVRQIDLELEYPCTVLHQLCYLMESKVGGTSGALYGIFFATMARAFEVLKDAVLLLNQTIFKTFHFQI